MHNNIDCSVPVRVRAWGLAELQDVVGRGVVQQRDLMPSAL